MNGEEGFVLRNYSRTLFLVAAVGDSSEKIKIKKIDKRIIIYLIIETFIIFRLHNKLYDLYI